MASYTEKHGKMTLVNGMEVTYTNSTIVCEGKTREPDFEVAEIYYRNTQTCLAKASGYCGEILICGYHDKDEYAQPVTSIYVKNKESADAIIAQFNACRNA